MLPADFPFDPYALIVIIGFFCALLVLELYFRKIHMPKGTATDYEILVAISAVIGFIFAILFQNLYDYIEDPENYTWTWAMTFMGGLFGGVLTFFIGYWTVLKKKRPGSLPALVAVGGAAIPLAHGIGRIACFLDGCCYGATIEEDSPFYWMGVEFRTTPGRKVWPTNIMESIFLLILAAVMLVLLFKLNSTLTMPIYMMSYGVWRFLIEFLRGDHRGDFIPGLTPSQFWSILLFAGGVAYLIYLIVKKKYHVTVYPDPKEKEVPEATQETK